MGRARQATSGRYTDLYGLSIRGGPYASLVDQELTLGLYLGRLRDERGLSLREVAKRAGGHFTRLGEWERGTDAHTGKPVTPPREAFLRLARVYGAPPDALLAMAGYRAERAPSPDEAQRFLEAAATVRWGIALTFALATGMRPSEMLGLLCQDVDLDAGLVAVWRALTRKAGGRHVTEPKTARSRRSIPLPAGPFFFSIQDARGRSAGDRLAAVAGRD